MLLLSIIAREFKQAARRKRMHWLRIALGCGIGTWFALVALRGTFFGAETLGRAVYDAVLFPLAYGVMLLAPALAAPVIAVERRNDTLGLLFLTQLKPFQIVVAKYTAVLLEVFGVVLLTVPLLCLPVLFGGLDSAEVISDALIVLALVIGCTALGTLTSSFLSSVTKAFVCAIAALFVCDALLVLVSEFSTFTVTMPRGVRLTTLARSYSAIYEPGHGIFNASALLLGPNVSLISAALGDVMIACVLAFGLLLVAGWQTRRLASGAIAPAYTRYVHFVKWAKEQALWPMIGVCAIAIALSVSGYLSELASHRFLSWVVVAITYFPFVGQFAFLLAIARRITGEKDNHTMESLLSTPMTDFQLLQRAVAGAWRRCWLWVLASYVPLLLAAAQTRGGRFIGFLLCDIAVGVSFAIAFGVFAASYAKNSRQALTWGVMLLGTATLLPEIVSRESSRGWLLTAWVDLELYFWTSVMFVFLAACVFFMTWWNYRLFAARQ